MEKLLQQEIDESERMKKFSERERVELNGRIGELKDKIYEVNEANKKNEEKMEGSEVLEEVMANAVKEVEKLKERNELINENEVLKQQKTEQANNKIRC